MLPALPTMLSPLPPPHDRRKHQGDLEAEAARDAGIDRVVHDLLAILVEQQTLALQRVGCVGDLAHVGTLVGVELVECRLVEGGDAAREATRQIAQRQQEARQVWIGRVARRVRGDGHFHRRQSDAAQAVTELVAQNQIGIGVGLHENAVGRSAAHADLLLHGVPERVDHIAEVHRAVGRRVDLRAAEVIEKERVGAQQARRDQLDIFVHGEMARAGDLVVAERRRVGRQR